MHYTSAHFTDVHWPQYRPRPDASKICSAEKIQKVWQFYYVGMGVQRQGSVFHIAAGVKKYGVPKIERPTCSTHRTLCPIVMYAPMVFVKVTPLMSKESGLSIMGDCQCSYTGSHPVQEAWGSQDSLYGCMQVDIPKDYKSEKNLFRKVFILKGRFFEKFYSEGPLFQRFFIPKGRHSEIRNESLDKNLQNNDHLG